MTWFPSMRSRNEFRTGATPTSGWDRGLTQPAPSISRTTGGRQSWRPVGWKEIMPLGSVERSNDQWFSRRMGVTSPLRDTG